MKKLEIAIITVIALASGVALADNINGVNIDFVNIGSAGNVADGTGYGAVGYNYRISQTEITVDQFAASGVGAGDYWSGLGGTAPAANITWHEAARYANWLTSGNANNGAYVIDGSDQVTAVDRASAISTYATVYVLPTEDEWYKAAYFSGSSYSLYANGTGTVPVDEVDAVYGRTQAAGPWIVGSGSLEQNGTVDMMGNVWEWMESTFGGEAYDPGNASQQMAFRGGDYFLGSSFLSSDKRANDDRNSATNIGLRIVAIPEPGVIGLMGLTTMGLLFIRRIQM